MFDIGEFIKKLDRDLRQYSHKDNIQKNLDNSLRLSVAMSRFFFSELRSLSMDRSVDIDDGT